ncbi:MAG: isoprenylcysteine carboxylmethyltransferase family protein [Gammaproteobacteria bacterium]|nr:isoprenylcysteine carboxylmethyltransferase family protein [Gammaproteobacteria bacterium]
MNKFLISFYGIVAYLVGLGGLTAFMFYMGSWSFLPLHINSRVVDSISMQAIMINLLILILFGLHHSIAARPHFKEWLAQLIPAAIERSSYVLISGLFMCAICFYWQPLAGMVWSTDNATVVLTLQVIHVLGWLVMVAATFEIDHFHLMGLKQSLSMNPVEDGELKENFLYSIVRHPIQTGILIGVWSTANMSMTQFILCICLTIYILIGLHFEEKSLEAYFGDTYLDYKKRVPGIIPFWPCKR